MVLTRCDQSCSSAILSKDFVVLFSRLSFEIVRLFRDDYLFVLELQRGKVLHFLLEVLVDHVVSELGSSVILRSLATIIATYGLLSTLHLLIIELYDFFQPLLQLLTHVRLHLLEALVQLNLLLKISLLSIALCYLLVLLIAGLEAHVLVVVSQTLHGENRGANFAIAFYPWDCKHIWDVAVSYYYYFAE